MPLPVLARLAAPDCGRLNADRCQTHLAMAALGVVQ